MVLSIKQPYFFSHLAYFQVIHAADKYIIHSNLNFIKEGWINRNRIMIINQGPGYIIVPTKNKSSYKKINEIEIDNSAYWRKNILKTILINYKRSPYFEQVYPMLQTIINYDTQSLSELATLSTIKVCEFLDIKTKIQSQTPDHEEIDYYLETNHPTDNILFNSLKRKGFENKVIRILYLAMKEKADVFIDSIGGKTLYDKNIFKNFNIDFKFLQMNSFTYKQKCNNFYPNLSVIDVLMNCGKEKTKRLLSEYRFV